MSKSWLKEVLEQNRKEVDRWPDWKRGVEPSSNVSKQTTRSNDKATQKREK